MYNRYVPADDGTYRRQVVEDHKKTQQSPPPAKPSNPKPQPPAPKPSPPQKGSKSSTAPLTSLLANVDKGDLIVLLILVLLLMDEERDNTSLLLTVALYFLMQ